MEPIFPISILSKLPKCLLAVSCLSIMVNQVKLPKPQSTIKAKHYYFYLIAK